MVETDAPAFPYTTEFRSAIERVDGRDVVLEETYFYPEGGGQPADRGTLADHRVVDVQSAADGVVHTLAEAPSVAAGETVVGEVDEAFRTYCMRAHTASHVLYGAGRRVLSDLGYGGFDISERKVRVDFTTSTRVDDDVIVELERLANRAVWESRPVTWETKSREEALGMERIAFNTKTEEGLEGETVRVVTIGGDDAPWDVAACGGTHVENTREIGPVAVLDRSNPGEGLTRVEFAVGPRAIERRGTEKRAALEASSAASTNVEALPEAVRSLQTEIEELETERETLKRRLANARVEELRKETVERDGGTWLVGTIEGMGPNDLGGIASEAAGDAADVVALVGKDGRTFLVVGAAEGFDASAVVDAATAEFGGGGGGSAETAQGGGIEAAPEDVVAYLRR